MKNRINRAEYLQLLALTTLARGYVDKANACRDAAYELLDAASNQTVAGHVDDVVWSDRGLDEAIKLMGITVEGGVPS